MRHVEEGVGVVVVRARHLASRRIGHARDEQVILEVAADVRQVAGDRDAEGL